MVERFFSHVVLLDDSEDTCWLWVGAMKDDGRGRFCRNGEEVAAHRVGWEIQNGRPVPEGYRLKPTCNRPDCVRHWRLGSRKLSADEVRQIVLSHDGSSALGKRYGVHRNTILWHRRTYCAAQDTRGRV
jgi:hypothetical protein